MSKELLVPKKYICIKKLAFFPQNSYLFQKSKKVFLSRIRAVPGFNSKQNLWRPHMLAVSSGHI